MQAWSKYWSEYRAHCEKSHITPMSVEALKDLYLLMLRIEARILGGRTRTNHVAVPIVFEPGKAPALLGCVAEFRRENHSRSGEYQLLNPDEVFSW